jgi:hypothetical protein
MDNTDNYNFKKPSMDDFVLITDINDNSDSLDTLLKDISDAITALQAIDHTHNTDTYLDYGGENQVSASDAKDAVTKKHSQNTDSALDSGGANEVTAINAKDAVSKKHTQNTDQYLDYGGENQSAVTDVKDAITKKHTQASDDNFATLDEITQALATYKLPIHNGTNYKNITRGNLLMGVAGGINFVLNPNFEGDTVGALPSGYAVYADAAGVAPVDGTGGSPTCTLLCSTTNILNGTKSVRFSKDAANRQGEGFSYDMAIPIGYRSQVCKIQMLIDPVNTIATGNFAVYLYDKTNSVLIQPTPYQIPGLVAGTPYLWSCEFQVPYNCAELRLIWHVATTSTSALAIDIDEIQVGPGTINQGSPIIELGSLPFTCINVPGTVVTKCMRVGCDLLVYFDVTITNVGDGIFYLVMPPGYIIDTAKCANGYYQVIGSANAEDVSDSYKKYGGNIALNSTTTQIRITPITGVSADWSTTIPFTWANGDNIRGFFRVPILGWGSNCQMSSEAETRVVSARCYRAAAYTQLDPNNSAVKIPLDSVSNDTHGGFDAANNRYVIKIQGYYGLCTQFGLDTSNQTNSYYFICVHKNGVEINRSSYHISAAPVYFTCQTLISGVLCNVGDYFEIFIYGVGDNSTNKVSLLAGPTFTYMDVYRISGPSQIAASEKVYAIYSSDAGNTINNNSSTILNFEDKESDSHGAVTVGASWKFTAPRAALYDIDVSIVYNDTTNFSGTELSELHLFKNGSDIRILFTNRPHANENYPQATGSTKIFLNAGDYIDIRALQSSGANIALVTLGTLNWISIASQG